MHTVTGGKLALGVIAKVLPHCRKQRRQEAPAEFLSTTARILRDV
jgi:hypothetical protein